MAGVSFTCVKQLLVELHYTLHITQTVIIFQLFIYDYAIKQRVIGGFLKLNYSNHPTVTTLRPAGADGIRTVMQGFESQPTWATSGGSRRRPDGSGRFRTAPGGF